MKRYMTCSYKLNQAPQQTSGMVPQSDVDGAPGNLSGGSVLVPSGPSRGIWNVSTGAWSQVSGGSAGNDAPLQVQVTNGAQNGLWVLEPGHTDASAYGSPVI